MGQGNEKVSITETPNTREGRDKDRRIFLDNTAPSSPIKNAKSIDLNNAGNSINYASTYKNVQNNGNSVNGNQQKSGRTKKNIFLSSESMCVKNRETIEEQEQPIYYYNGWSLPTTKCYLNPPEREFKPIHPKPNPSPPKNDEPKPKPEPEPDPIIPPKPVPPKPDPPRPIIMDPQVDINGRVQNLFMF